MVGGAAALGNSLSPPSQDPVNNLIEVYKPHIMDATCSGLSGGSGSHSCLSSVREVTGSVPTAAPVSGRCVRYGRAGVSACQVEPVSGKMDHSHWLFGVTDGFYY